jgi:hypothetical protein
MNGGMIALPSCRQTRNWLIVLLWRFRASRIGRITR